MIQDIFDPELYLALFEAKDPTTNSTVSMLLCCYGWLLASAGS